MLLVRDKEGLNEERLQNGRYGLTGKPALAQQGIAGSLSASFKAGQQVTVSNLRSLNDKLREAQKALDNANNNIDQVDQTQDKMDDAKDEVNRLLSTGLWEKLWNGTISPFEFYAGKYAEDTSNEAMAGEPGFPVQDIGEVMSAPPIPRLQYWDPFAKFGWFRIVATDTDEFAYLCKDWNFFGIVTRNRGQVNDVLRQLITEQVLLGVLVSKTILLASMSSVAGAVWTTGMITLISVMLGVLVTAVAFMQSTLTYLVDRAEIHNFSGYNISNWVSSPTCYHAGDTVIKDYLIEPGIFGAFLGAAINTALLIGLANAAITMYGIARGLKSNPLTFAAGIALTAAADGVAVVFQTLCVSTVAVPIAVQFGLFGSLSIARTLTGTSNIATAQEAGPDSGTYSISQIEGKAGLDNLGFLRVLSAMTSLGISELIKALDGDRQRASVKSYRANKFLRYNYEESRLANRVTTETSDTGILTPFDSWWPSPIVNVNLDDVADGTLVGGPIQQPTFLGRVNHKCVIKSQVFRGDYFGAQRGIKLLEGRTITNTVVVRAKLTANNYTYYACGVLVTTNTTGNQLHLLWERNAIYDFNENTSMPQVEQMIYNYEPTALPVKDFFTGNRTGRLQYVYGKFKTGKGESTFQLRNVQRAWPNYLNGQLINTEYTFGPMTVLSSGPRCTWGDLSSYMYL